MYSSIALERLKIERHRRSLFDDAHKLFHKRASTSSARVTDSRDPHLSLQATSIGLIHIHYERQEVDSRGACQLQAMSNGESSKAGIFLFYLLA